MRRLPFIATLWWLIELKTFAEERPAPCSSDIYCHGKLLHTVQMAKIFSDSKTFVDMKMHAPPKETMAKFLEFMEETENAPNKLQVKNFVNSAFEAAGKEFEDWLPPDWVPSPKFVDQIADSEYRHWALDLNNIWKDLGRKIKNEVKQDAELYSIIWVPNPVIVPGGRFREFYYWDSYWILSGILLSEMHDTARGMLSNFLYVVNQIGHIPNGGRVYYHQRSQPPLFIPMVKLYFDHTDDVEFIATNIETMEKEYNFWLNNHMVQVVKDAKTYDVAIYKDHSYGPRPESYSEDVEAADVFKDPSQKEEFYSELKASAESGWDFSSRYFVVKRTKSRNLSKLKTRSVALVDLNSILCWNARLLSEFYQLAKNANKAAYYKEAADKWIETVTAVFWHAEVGAWLDYDMYNLDSRNNFYPSNLAPLWARCYNQSDKNKIVPLVLKYVEKTKVLQYVGGIPTTLLSTGEQWDFPNAWPPLQHIIITGLDNTGNPEAQRLAFRIAQNWVQSNYHAYSASKHMFEKYDATVFGSYGEGGEYDIQLGFGWTNGVILDLLNRYGKNLHSRPAPHNRSTLFKIDVRLLSILILIFIQL